MIFEVLSTISVMIKIRNVPSIWKLEVVEVESCARTGTSCWRYEGRKLDEVFALAVYIPKTPHLWLATCIMTESLLEVWQNSKEEENSNQVVVFRNSL